MNTPEIILNLPNRIHSALLINCANVAQNYHILKAHAPTSQIAPVLKANAYGLGMNKLAPLLYQLGAREFFVAYLDEAIDLYETFKNHLGKAPQENFIKIYVLNGFLSNTESEFAHYNLIPVISSIDQLYRWTGYATQIEKLLPACLHVDTGMARSGFELKEFFSLKEAPDLFTPLYIDLVMSHLASAEQKESPFNLHQLELFKNALAIFPKARASLSNSSAVFLGSSYHFDVLRPGIALWGGNPKNNPDNPMKPVVDVFARIIEIRNLKPPHSVGYNQTHWIKKPTRVATLALGYADGFAWNMSNKGFVQINGYNAPIVGRISMDLVTADITDIPFEDSQINQWAHVIGEHNTIDQIATQAQTKAYELLLNLGTRFERIYTSY